MLIWLVFLSALASIVSHQQFRRLRQPFWLHPHALPNYHHYELIDDNAGHLTPRQQIKGPEIRRKVDGMEDERIIDRLNLRFLLYYANDNLLYKTVTLTITTTQDVTSVQTCLNVDRFVNVSSISVICKRKKREILQDSSVGDPIEPSHPEKPLMTTIPAGVIGQLERGTRHLLDDPDLFISSSKDDDVIGSDESTPAGTQEYYPKKQKRFYYPFVATTTEYSFVLNSYVVTKTIKLAPFLDLICRPSEFVVCST